MNQDHMAQREANPLDLSEKGRRDDKPISLDRRLFMQFLAFHGERKTDSIIKALEKQPVGGALYRNVNDPRGIGLLTYSESPDTFLERVRPLVNRSPFSGLTINHEFTMLGRTYSLGYEEDLERTLITRPIQRVTNPDFPWAIWYPVRRSGSFETLSPEEQRTILMEHGGIGQAYGKAGLAQDIRLACHGLDIHDNDFVIGIVGPQLYPLSRLVQRMRKTKQTSQYLENLGPFFVGKAVWQKKVLETDAK